MAQLFLYSRLFNLSIILKELSNILLETKRNDKFIIAVLLIIYTCLLFILIVIDFIYLELYSWTSFNYSDGFEIF